MSQRQEIIDRLQNLADDLTAEESPDSVLTVMELHRLIDGLKNDRQFRVGEWGFSQGQPLHLPSYNLGKKDASA